MLFLPEYSALLKQNMFAHLLKIARNATFTAVKEPINLSLHFLCLGTLSNLSRFVGLNVVDSIPVNIWPPMMPGRDHLRYLDEALVCEPADNLKRKHTALLLVRTLFDHDPKHYVTLARLVFMHKKRS